jgi:K+-sensing histidine kinase KdpD
MANTLAGRLGRITKSRDVRAGLAGLVAIAAVTGGLRAVQDEPNPTIAALLLLLAVLVTGTLSSLLFSIVISITATLAFVFFLLPPFEVWTFPTRRTGWRSSLPERGHRREQLSAAVARRRRVARS